MKLFRLITLILILLILSPVTNLVAETNPNLARKSLRTIRLEIKRLKRLVNKPGVRSSLTKAATRSPVLNDSDSDGLPDLLENVEGTNSCDDDSDSDGISDGDESSSDSDPDDSESSELEIKGNISAITSTTVTVGEYTFTANESTEYRDATSLADFEVGDFVEVEGRVISGTLILEKIAEED